MSGRFTLGAHQCQPDLLNLKADGLARLLSLRAEARLTFCTRAADSRSFVLYYTLSLASGLVRQRLRAWVFPLPHSGGAFMETYFCRIITLGQAFPRFATVRCQAGDVTDVVADQLEGWEPFDVVEVRDDRDTLLITIAGDNVSFRN